MRVLPICLLLLSLMVPNLSWAYNRVVHYYTTVFVVDYIEQQPNHEELKVISFCAQLPDETIEYDAARQYAKLLLKKPGDFAT